MIDLKQTDFWLIVGSQHLYGEETLQKVRQHAAAMAEGLDQDPIMPCRVRALPVATTPEDIVSVMAAANADPKCAGVITWMHTFSPSKMWIAGLSLLHKPYCHLHTQFNRSIPNEGIDMDFMNLNQSAHGDREHGFIGARLRMPRKIVVGYWEDAPVRAKIAGWMRAAVGTVASRSLKVMRFGDNMRQVAVTEGDKVEAQIKLGWQVNTWPVGELAGEIDRVTDTQVDARMDLYFSRYTLGTQDMAAVRYQARADIAMEAMLTAHGCGAFTNTFEDLTGMAQLPGLATQSLMAEGFGYGGEGDWKTAAMTRVIKDMTRGMPGGTSFMEDYTYDLAEGGELSLGAHMLEVCPSIAAGRARIEVHPLGIGNRNPPARLVFEGRAGSATVSSLVDMGGRLRLIVQEVEAVKPIYDMPNLPVARVMWKAAPDFSTAAECWIRAGGAHHTVLSYDATVDMLEDWAEILGLEFVRIGRGTTLEAFKQQLFLNDLAWKLR